MTKIDQNKILENKIKANALDFNLNRQSAIVSAFADGNFDKYEYLTRIDLALKPNSLQKARFEHSPLGNLLNKNLKVSSDNVDNKKDYSDSDDVYNKKYYNDSDDDDTLDSPKQIIDNIDDEYDDVDLARLDELLNNLKEHKEFLKDFKTNMDNIDNEQANKDKQEKLEAIELIENLRDDLEKKNEIY